MSFYEGFEKRAGTVHSLAAAAAKRGNKLQAIRIMRQHVKEKADSVSRALPMTLGALGAFPLGLSVGLASRPKKNTDSK